VCPLAVAAITGLAGRGAGGEQVPGCVGAELPEDSVEDESVWNVGTATRRWRGREEVLKEGPLMVGEEHS